MPIKLKSPPLGTLKWGDFNFPGMAAFKVEVPPHFKHKSEVHAGLSQLYAVCGATYNVKHKTY